MAWKLPLAPIASRSPWNASSNGAAALRSASSRGPTTGNTRAGWNTIVYAARNTRVLTIVGDDACLGGEPCRKSESWCTRRRQVFVMDTVALSRRKRRRDLKLGGWGLVLWVDWILSK